MKKFLSQKRQEGFSVLFASVVGGMILLVGFAILSITLKQVTLASAGRESQKAFYAADTGTECALFLDNGGGFKDECQGEIFPIPGRTQKSSCVTDHVYSCSGVELNGPDTPVGTFKSELLDPVTEGGDSYERMLTTVHVKNTSTVGEPICFDLYVTKKSKNGGDTVKTELESRGYSVCNERAGNRFERAILTTY